MKWPCCVGNQFFWRFEVITELQRPLNYRHLKFVAETVVALLALLVFLGVWVATS